MLKSGIDWFSRCKNTVLTEVLFERILMESGINNKSVPLWPIHPVSHLCTWVSLLKSQNVQPCFSFRLDSTHTNVMSEWVPGLVQTIVFALPIAFSKLIHTKAYCISWVSLHQNTFLSHPRSVFTLLSPQYLNFISNHKLTKEDSGVLGGLLLTTKYNEIQWNKMTQTALNCRYIQNVVSVQTPKRYLLCLATYSYPQLIK